MKNGCWNLTKSDASTFRCKLFHEHKGTSFPHRSFLLLTLPHTCTWPPPPGSPAHRPAVAGTAPYAQHRSQNDDKNGAHHCQEDPHIIIWLGERAERERVILLEGTGTVCEEDRNPGDTQKADGPLESSAKGMGWGEPAGGVGWFLPALGYS